MSDSVLWLRRIGAVLCLGLVFCTSACGWQNRLVFRPMPEVFRTPAERGLAYEDVWITTSDGVRLNGWYVATPGPRRGAMLMCHGNGGNIAHMVELAGMCRSLGLDVLVFDYRGYGRSAGVPTEEGTYLDAQACWDYLVKQRGFRPEQVVLYGISMGGGVASHQATVTKPAALILTSTFISIPEVGGDLIWWLPTHLLACVHYPVEKNMKKVKCPVLVAHSREDTLISFRHGEAVFKAASEPKEFVEIHGNHLTGWYDSRATYVPAMARFLDKHMGPLQKK